MIYTSPSLNDFRRLAIMGRSDTVLWRLEEALLFSSANLMQRIEVIPSLVGIAIATSHFIG